MNLTPMRFKNNVWPHIPRVLKSASAGICARIASPSGSIAPGHGAAAPCVQGGSAFAGEGAYREFQKLASVFYDATPGVLVHRSGTRRRPARGALAAAGADGNYVAYSFEFWECYDGYPRARSV
jgi:hypothetical protein